MVENISNGSSFSTDKESHRDFEALESMIEQAYRTYKLSELYLKDVDDDYGKLKIARLRLEFARHRLLELMKEASVKGVKLTNQDLLKNFYYPDS